MSLFEIVDVTDDEIYFTIAVYDDFKIAKEELLEKAGDNRELTDSGNDFEEIEIRNHNIGWKKGYKTKLKLHRHQAYFEETDEYKWINNYEEFD